MNWTAKDIKDKGYAQINGGAYEPIKNQVSKKAEKLPNLLERAIGKETNGAEKLIDSHESEVKIWIKTLSVNKAWKGRRFKTKEHEAYADAVMLLLPNNLEVPDGLLKISYEFGMSSRGSDFDNPVKMVTDILSKKYAFNDNRIMEAHIKKVIVKKGDEYIKFRIESFK